MEDLDCSIRVRTSVINSPLMGRDKEVEALTNNIVSAMELKWSIRNGSHELENFLVLLFVLSLQSHLVT